MPDKKYGIKFYPLYGESSEIFYASKKERDKKYKIFSALKNSIKGVEKIEK